MDTPKFYETPEYAKAHETLKKWQEQIVTIQTNIKRLKMIRRKDLTESDRIEYKAARKELAEMQAKCNFYQNEMANLPQPRISSAYLKQRVTTACEETLKQYEKSKEDFIKRVNSNPEDALGMMSDDMVTAQEFAREATYILDYANKHSYRELADWLDGQTAEITAQIIRFADGYYYSTSPATNMIEKFKAAAWTQMIGDFPRFEPLREARINRHYSEQYVIEYDDQRGA